MEPLSADKPILVLPAEPAKQASFVEGKVQIILGEQSIIVVTTTSPANFSSLWEVLSTTLHKQATLCGLTSEDHRDAEYWEIVAPLFEELVLGLSGFFLSAVYVERPHYPLPL